MSSAPQREQPAKPQGSAAAASHSAASALGAERQEAEETALPVQVVSSVAEFQSIFQQQAPQKQEAGAHRHQRQQQRHQDAFLLCYEQPGDAVTPEGLQRFRQGVEDAARTHHTRLRLYLWDCTSTAFAPAKAQLDKQPGHPLLLVVFNGAIADSVRDTPLAAMTATDVPRICERLASFQLSAKPARVVVDSESTSSSAASAAATASTPQRLSVDVAKMVGMGKKLMAERKPFYAEKFFAKALQALDAVAGDVDRLVAAREDYDGSVALCLAWAGLAQLVQGTHLVNNPHLTRLRASEHLRPYYEEPMSETCRALVTWDLMLAAPRTWTEAECSAQKLCAGLQASPHDAAARSMLVVTYFLSGDVERALTEALKLHVCREAFGRVALRLMCAFLGDEHALVKQLGVSKLLGTVAAE